MSNYESPFAPYYYHLHFVKNKFKSTENISTQKTKSRLEMQTKYYKKKQQNHTHDDL